jgi:hypothetical protein
MPTTFHVFLNIRHYLKTASNRELSRMFRSNGRYMTADEAKDVLLDELAKGHIVTPVGSCTNFDFSGGGCLGHPDKQKAIALVDALRQKGLK